MSNSSKSYRFKCEGCSKRISITVDTENAIPDKPVCECGGIVLSQNEITASNQNISNQKTRKYIPISVLSKKHSVKSLSELPQLPLLTIAARKYGTKSASCCDIYYVHSELLKGDPERLSTDFIKSICLCGCD